MILILCRWTDTGALVAKPGMRLYQSANTTMEPTADRLFVECSRLSAAAHLNRYAAEWMPDYSGAVESRDMAGVGVMVDWRSAT